MTPIETRYKGYRFRSRLEARWAVFFDALGLRWEYEPEGFELGGGVRYLPDFKLDGLYFAEVKPEARDGCEFDKARLLARQGATVIGLGGLPSTIAYPVWEGDGVADVAINTDCKYGPFFWCCGVELWADWREAFPLTGGDAEGMRRAISAARGARFEHGEVPQL